MFRKLHKMDQPVTVFVDGEPHQAEPGDSVAAVLVRQSALWVRKTPVSGKKRAPFCMMGACFECLATVDGNASVQTCMVRVKEGMRIERQIGVRKFSS